MARRVVARPALADPVGAMTDLRLFLCGDVMLGRGVDQIPRHPSDPRIFKQQVDSALTYVRLAEAASGRRIPRLVAPTYVWGDALAVLRAEQPAARIINLETAITTSDDYAVKGINYRMHPGNIDCLTAAGIDCCVLANNHVLDWGRSGLLETLATPRRAEIGRHHFIAGACLVRYAVESASREDHRRADNGRRVSMVAGLAMHAATLVDWLLAAGADSRVIWLYSVIPAQRFKFDSRGPVAYRDAPMTEYYLPEKRRLPHVGR
jgi:poly-gamma-glutamate capsule biosynthesis protein CapA/YwtB (metallophosphatase superfamily)